MSLICFFNLICENVSIYFNAIQYFVASKMELFAKIPSQMLQNTGKH